MHALRFLYLALLWTVLPLPAAAQDVRHTMQTDWFTARVLVVESDGAGGKRVSVAFTASARARGRVVTIRLTEGDCRLPASFADRRGNELISAHCVRRGSEAADRGFTLAGPGTPVVRHYRFAGAAGRTILGPYDVFIPVIAFIEGTKGEAPEQVVTSLSFFALR